MENATALFTTLLTTVTGWIGSILGVVTSYAGDKEKYGKWVIAGVILWIVSRFAKVNLNVGSGKK